MVCLQLGSNKGDRLQALQIAIKALKETFQIVDKSAVYQTAAWGNTNQQDFYNQLVLVETKRSPYSVLRFCQNVENQMGRERKDKWGPRIIDIDIIYYDKKVIYSPTLKIPHEYMHARRFILIPLLDMKNKWTHPLLGKTIQELLASCNDKSEVKQLKS